jgi:hypothetical protein
MSQHPFRAACTPIVQRALLVLGGAFLLFAPPAGAGRVRPQTSGPVFEAFSIPSVAAGRVRCVATDPASRLVAVVSDGQGLTVVDLDTQRSRTLRFSGVAYSVLVSGEIVYVAETTTSGLLSLQAIDAAKTKSSLSVTQTIALPGTFEGYEGKSGLDDWMLYVPGSTAGLQMVDVSRAAYPRYVGATWTSFGVMQVDASDHRAAVLSTGGSRFALFDTSQPSAPKVLYSGPYSGVDVATSGGLVLMQGSGVQLLDFSQPSSPRVLAVSSLGSPSNGNFEFWGSEVVEFPTSQSIRVYRQNPPLELIGEAALDWVIYGKAWASDPGRIYAVDRSGTLHALERNF